MFGAYYFGETIFAGVFPVTTSPAPIIPARGLRPSKIRRILDTGNQEQFEDNTMQDLQVIITALSLFL